MLGGLEILAICGIIGGFVGYALRKKGSKNATIISIVVGIIGACFMTWLLVTILIASYLLMPVYGAFGAWLALYILKRIG
ncbi:MAG TPA: hypothetical protein VIM65_03830 [Cyclobacteriaceae bacterium]